MEGKEAGEMRRLHIIYFLSRMGGRTEHPHLIRVHHLNRGGVFLRDVKRWLADLRGKDMPESFAWSFKRRYKMGYVWQDLLDDDLITPISDNEFVLKGSEISSVSFEADPCSDGEKITPVKKQEPLEVEDDESNQASQNGDEIQGPPVSETHFTSKTSSEITEESPKFSSERSTLTEDSVKPEESEKPVETGQGNSDEQGQNLIISSSHWTHKYKKKNNNNTEKKGTSTSSASSKSTSSSSFTTKSRSHSSMLRNLMTCGAIDTKDSVMVMISRSDKPCSNNSASASSDDKQEMLCPGDKFLARPGRVFGTSWNNQAQQHHTARQSWDGMKDWKKDNKGSEFANQKAVPAAYKPVGSPNCSQCGKSFKPEKLHTHMKSCKGMKALAKSSAAAIEKTSFNRSVNSSKEAYPAYYLTH